jgi:spermidine synthase
LAEVESAYQRVRVTEQSFPEGDYRFLSVNEVSDSYQSVWTERPGFLGPGFYYDDFALPAWLTAAREPETPRAWRVAILGLGGGTAWRVLSAALPEGFALEGAGVELDRDVIRLGREHLALDEATGLEVLAGLDARVGLHALEGPFDTIVCDVYANAIEIPPHLSTVEFFREAREKLVPGGWIVANVGAFGLDDPVLEHFAATLSAAFERPVLALPVKNARNVTVLARREAEVPAPGSDAYAAVADVARWLVAPRRAPGGFRWIDADDAPVATDDHNPIDALAARALRRTAQAGTP